MRTPSDILSEIQAPFEWGKHDCISTMKAFVTEYIGPTEVFDQFHQMEEPDSWRASLKEHGSLLGAYRHHLLQLGMVETEPPYRPGDFVISSGVTKLTDGAQWNGKHGRELALFVDNSYRLWYWGASGLLPAELSEPPTIIFRFPKLYPQG